jgi:PAS domain S-box-containing protein
MGDKILVVTESPELGSELAGQLARWDHTPVVTPGPGKTCSLMAEHRPPLAIVDNALAGADSLQLVRRLRHEHPWTELIFLVFPGHLERGAQSLELGASDFLVKPVSASRLGIALKRAQERLSVKRKLAVLSGQPIDDPQAPELAILSEELARGTECAIRLYDTQQQYQQLFNEVPCYIAVLDPSYRLVAANRRFKEDFGYGIGDHFRVHQKEGERPEEGPVAQTFRDGQTHRYEQVVSALTGEQYTVLTSTAPLRNSQGDITHVMSMSVNITEIRKLQDHLSSLGMLIGSISHGVKGLLTALDGGMYSMRVGFAQEDYQRVEKGWEVVELMVERIKRTVLDVLYYAKDREVETEEVDVAEFARQLARTAEYAAVKHGLGFEFHLGRGLGSFWVDPNALNPAIVNILENAVDACLEAGEPTRRKIVFGVYREDDVIVFDVQDDGLGMDQKTKDNMFTLFFTSKGSSGTGLGLFIANDTVNQHGGAITVDSEPGEGSHFHVRVPFKPRAVLLEEREQARAAAG